MLISYKKPLNYIVNKILTKNLKQIGDLLGIPVIDHIIVGEGYYSFCENGEIWKKLKKNIKY